MIKKRKPRLLLVNEASFLKTGFAKIGHEILTRLHQNGNVEIAELGSYAQRKNPRHQEEASRLPWKFYYAEPSPEDKVSQHRANKPLSIVDPSPSRYAQFGSAVFEQVCLDFEPDVVFDIRDQWMSSGWQLKSPFRRYFKYMIMPTVDGKPQRLEWLDEYARADRLLVYTDFAKRTLEEEAPNLSVHNIVRPGVNHDIFKPIPQEHARNLLGLEKDCNIILTVMRNQKRKLFPDLIRSFDMFLKKCVQNGDVKTAKDTYLYLHTSYPDVGFDLQKFIMKYGLGHKVLMTYLCRACGHFFPSFFRGELVPCSQCGNHAAGTPNTDLGITDEQLSVIFNAADVYVQMSICEGLGMPPVEARACEVPVFCTDYSAIEDQAHEPGGSPIKVKEFFYEAVIETEQMRAIPDKDSLVDGLIDFFNMSKSNRESIGKKAREFVSNNYSFERAAKIVEETIFSMDYPDHSLTWKNPNANMCPMNTNVPNGLSNSDFVDWCIENILGRPDLISSYWRDELIKSLNCGVALIDGSGGARAEFNREVCYNLMMNKANENNQFEQFRVGSIREGQNNNQVKWVTV